jgi:hypothetical protein
MTDKRTSHCVRQKDSTQHEQYLASSISARRVDLIDINLLIPVVLYRVVSKRRCSVWSSERAVVEGRTVGAGVVIVAGTVSY